MNIQTQHTTQYKNSPLGLIPQDWEVMKISEITEYVDYRGKTPKKTDYGILLLTARNIKQGYIDYDVSKEYISEEDYANVMSRGLPEIGDVLVTTEAPMGNVAQINRFDIALAQRVIKFRAKSNIIINDYLKYYLLSEKFQRILDEKSTGGTVKGIKGSTLHKMNLVVPSLGEQKNIADCLSTWDKAIEKNSALISQKELSKKALMQQLLSGKKRLKGFSVEWKEVRIKEVFKHIKNINDGGDNHSIMTISSKLGLISQEDKFDRVIAGDSLKKYTQLKKGDFAYNKGNSKTYPMGCVYQLEDKESALVPFVYICFSPTEFVDPKLYKHWFFHHGLDRQLNKIITSGARGDGLLNVNTNDFFSLKIALPPKDEQTAIANVLQYADTEIQLLKNKLAQLKEQKKGLMQVLLTGKKRLKY